MITESCGVSGNARSRWCQVTEFGCVEHDGQRSNGYGRDRGRAAHVTAWERERGPVPADRVLDHLCCNRACVALHHLEPVTQRENVLRRSFAYRSRIRLCPVGHDMQLHAVVTPHGGRVCRKCNQEARQ